MQEITISQAQKLTSPNPFGLVCTCDAEGRANLMALSWWTYVSNRPATIAVCLSQKGYSGSVIKATGEFALCLPRAELAQAAFACGTCSGRDTDKAEKFAIELEPASAINGSVVKRSRVVFECKVVNAVPAGDHDLFIAEVAAIRADPESTGLWSFEGYAELRPV